jgi:hypothetical protein
MCSRALDLVKLSRLIRSEGGDDLSVDEIPDTHKRFFNDDWLLSWKQAPKGKLDK